MADKTIPILSLFSGVGGLDLGFRREGFEPLLAIDNDPVAVRTYIRNQGQVAETSNLASRKAARDIVRLWKSRAYEDARGVIGGPPCQAFSSSNVHPIDGDGRAKLVAAFSSIVEAFHREFDIDFFVFENVTGLDRPQHKRRLNNLKRKLEQWFDVFTLKINAADYGVPQNRSRLFVVGFNRKRYSRTVFLQPVPTFKEPRTVRWAIGQLSEPAYYARGLDPKKFPEHPNHWTMRPKSRKFSSRLLRKSRMKGRSFRVLQWNKPSWTVSYGHREIHVHPRGHRRLSVFEAMLLQGFPSSYRILGTLSDQVRLVSDAVPPLLAQAVAKSLRLSLDANLRKTLRSRAGKQLLVTRSP
jgi:DNA (cytosine-5)-methyltransferase 1